jgi:hypothetical protein
MDINDRLNELLGANQAKRLAVDKAREERRDNPKILRHTTYQGDRNIQQLGDEIIENGVVLNNQSVAIGDVMLPLAKGNVLRRVDNTNGGALLGSAYRKAVENDYDANGNRRNNALSRNGGDEDPDPSNPNDPRNKPKLPPSFPPPFGCSPPPPQCLWTSDPNVPNGYQSHGSAVVNENGIELFLYCTAGTAVAPDLGCDFLNNKWTCSSGVCSPSPTGNFNSKAECESTLRWVANVFTNGICRPSLPPDNCILDSPSAGSLVRTFNISNAQYPISVIIDNRIPPGYTGFNHYKFVDNLGSELDYIAASSAGYYVEYLRTCG